MKRESEPVYIKAFQSGILDQRISLLQNRLKNCDLCPRQCKVNRLEDERGTCKTGKLAVVSSYMPHFGEEAPLVGRHGSGTIFFTHCNLLCNFCQNYDISHEGKGYEVTDRELSDMMLSLQSLRCHNINFVTPSHVVPQILSALKIAIENGLHIPLVYNSGGYDSTKTLQALDGIIDIYMPDFKFWNPEVSKLACQAPDYPEMARKAVKEMHSQVEDLILDENGIARRGLLIRHLVMPNNLASTREIMSFISKEISVHSYVNIMPQYRPCGKAFEYPLLKRPITYEEFYEALNLAREAGITRLDKE